MDDETEPEQRRWVNSQQQQQQQYGHHPHPQQANKKDTTKYDTASMPPLGVTGVTLHSGPPKPSDRIWVESKDGRRERATVRAPRPDGKLDVIYDTGKCGTISPSDGLSMMTEEEKKTYESTEYYCNWDDGGCKKDIQMTSNAIGYEISFVATAGESGESKTSYKACQGGERKGIICATVTNYRKKLKVYECSVKDDVTGTTTIRIPRNEVLACIGNRKQRLRMNHQANLARGLGSKDIPIFPRTVDANVSSSFDDHFPLGKNHSTAFHLALLTEQISYGKGAITPISCIAPAKALYEKTLRECGNKEFQTIEDLLKESSHFCNLKTEGIVSTGYYEGIDITKEEQLLRFLEGQFRKCGDRWKVCSVSESQ